MYEYFKNREPFKIIKKSVHKLILDGSGGRTLSIQITKISTQSPLPVFSVAWILLQSHLAADLCSEYKHPAEHPEPGREPVKQAGDHQELDHLNIQMFQAVSLREAR